MGDWPIYSHLEWCFYNEIKKILLHCSWSCLLFNKCSGSFIHYIRSLFMNDNYIPSAPWILSLLDFHHNHPHPTSEALINSRRLGVMLIAQYNRSLALQIWALICIYKQITRTGLSYGSSLLVSCTPHCILNFILTLKEPLQMHSPYVPTWNKNYQKLFTSFSPTHTWLMSPNHSLWAKTYSCWQWRSFYWNSSLQHLQSINIQWLTEWLYSVPFPPPPRSVSWNYDNGNDSLFGHIEEIVLKKFQPNDDTSDQDNKSNAGSEEDEELDDDNNLDDLNHTNTKFSMEQFQTNNTFFMSLPVSEHNNLVGKGKPPQFGNECILQYDLPHTTVKNICIPEPQLENTSWFYTVFTKLYGDNTISDGWIWKFFICLGNIIDWYMLNTRFLKCRTNFFEKPWEINLLWCNTWMKKLISSDKVTTISIISSLMFFAECYYNKDFKTIMNHSALVVLLQSEYQMNMDNTSTKFHSSLNGNLLMVLVIIST